MVSCSEFVVEQAFAPAVRTKTCVPALARGFAHPLTRGKSQRFLRALQVISSLTLLGLYRGTLSEYPRPNNMMSIKHEMHIGDFA